GQRPAGALQGLPAYQGFFLHRRRVQPRQEVSHRGDPQGILPARFRQEDRRPRAVYGRSGSAEGGGQHAQGRRAARRIAKGDGGAKAVKTAPLRSRLGSESHTPIRAATRRERGSTLPARQPRGPAPPRGGRASTSPAWRSAKTKWPWRRK